MTRQDALLRSVLGIIVLAALAATPLSAQADEGITVDFKPKSYPKWSFILPSEQWTAVGTEVSIPHADGTGFAAVTEGVQLTICTRAGDKSPKAIKGVSGFVELRGRRADGSSLRYGLRVQQAGGGYQWASATVLAGKAKGVALSLIDQNNNGRYDDFGVDAMLVGRSKAASYLSRVVNLKGELYTLDLTDEGRSATLKPFTGEAGMVNLRKGFRARGSLDSIVVANAEGDVSFELSKSKRGMTVPAGDYRIVAGLARSGNETARILGGRMDPITVSTDGTATPTWGAPVAIEFDYALANGQLTVQPTALNWFGSAGEQYTEWVPDAVSPKILVKDAKSGRVLEEGRFGGC